jgi:predicted permease
MAQLVADVRYAIRSLSKAPLFTTLAVASLAFSLGANTAIFTLLDQVVLRTLPVERPDEIVQVRIEGAFSGNSYGDGSELSYPMYRDFSDQNAVFAGMFARFDWAMHVSAGSSTERAAGELVSGSYFPVLGVAAAQGRLFTPDDDRKPGGHAVAVLGYDYWKNRFAGSPAVVGRKITVNSHPFTVIGVAAEGFHGIDLGSATQIYVPMMMKAQMTPGWNMLDDRRGRFARVFARLKPGVIAGQAQASLQPFFKSIREKEMTDAHFTRVSDYHKQEFRRATIAVVPAPRGHSGLRDYLTQPLYTLMAIVGGVLLIACANVAGLLLARGMARQREIAIRLALGGTRWRVARQLLVESLVLALLGAASGLIVAVWGSSLLVALFVDSELGTSVNASPDVRVLAFNFGLAILTGVVFGLVPAWQATKPAIAPTLKDQAGSVLSGGSVRLRRLLVVLQVALSLLLLVGAALFVRSLRNLVAQNPGFDTTNVVTFMVEPSLNGYSPQRTKRLAANLIERVRALPGVSAVSMTGIPILDGGSWNSSVTIEGYRAKDGEEVVSYNNTVMPGYFATMRIPLLRGRDFTDRDARVEPTRKGESEARVAIANRRFVERYFGQADPIGRHVGFGASPSTPTPIEIVGVVGTSKYVGIRDEAEPQLFFSMLEGDNPRTFAVYVRTTAAPEAAFASLRRTMREIDPNLPVYQMRTLDDQVNRSLLTERVVAGLSASLGIMATLLGVIGLYGVMSQTVARRTREVGIRMALGARSAGVAWMFARDATVLVLIGVALALPAIWALGRKIQSQLYGIEPLDPVTLVAAILGLGAAASLGALVPAMRAARIDPLQALREE